MRNKNKAVLGTVITIYICIFSSLNVLAMETEISWPESPDIMGDSAIVMEASTGVVIYEKNVHNKNYPASITKIMTALVALENSQLNEKVVIPYDAVYMEDKGSHIALDQGEELTVEQCLYAIMLASANDASHALAEYIGGTVEEFVKMMNEKANELGCQNTNFVTPHGLPNEEHLTSAYDMALITREAVKNEEFRKISGTSYYEIPPSEKQKDLIQMYNHHKMLRKGEFTYEYTFSGKPGYTQVAKHTLVTCAKKDNIELICVIMKEEGSQIYTDTMALLEYGFNNYKKLEIDDKEEQLTKNIIKDNNLALETEEIFLIVPKEAQLADIQVELIKNNNTEESTFLNYTYAGRTVGTAPVSLQECIAVEDNIRNEETETETDFFEERKVLRWIGNVIKFIIFSIMAFMLCLYRTRTRIRRRRRKKNTRRKR